MSVSSQSKGSVVSTSYITVIFRCIFALYTIRLTGITCGIRLFETDMTGCGTAECVIAEKRRDTGVA